MGTLREEQCAFLMIFRSFFLRMRNVSDKFIEKIKINILYLVFFFPPKNGPVYDVMWTNILEPDWLGMITRRLRFACWITRTTDTHSEYVIPISLPL